MVRTKDLLIFVGILFFLALCIALTILGDIRFSTQDTWMFFNTQKGDTTAFTAESPQTDINRESIIDRLRSALAQNDIPVEPSPSVESVVVATATSTQEESTGDEVVTSGAQLCTNYGNVDDLARTWPLDGVVFAVEGATRNVLYTHVQDAGVDINASTTQSNAAVSSKVLLSVPVSPSVGGPSCLQNDVIGVTMAGALMFNSEASFYRGYGPEYLIGYARDGFPIYGYYEGQLDTCGGYMHAQGYRYSISKDRSTVLNCFMGTQASFAQ